MLYKTIQHYTEADSASQSDRSIWDEINFWNLKPASTISCILSIEIRFKICRKVPVFHTKIRKKRTKVTKFIHQHTTSNNRLSWKSKITVVRKFSNVHHLETAAQRQLGKMFIWWSSSMYRSCIPKQQDNLWQSDNELKTNCQTVTRKRSPLIHEYML
jgi:hypothetical protein